MAKCDYCDSTIVIGDISDGERRFCSEVCQQKALVLERVEETSTSTYPSKERSTGLGPLAAHVVLPLPVPWIVKNGYGVIGLAAIVFTIPGFMVFSLAGIWLLARIWQFTGLRLFEVPLFVGVLGGFLIAVLPAFWLVYGRTSKFLVACVRELALQGKEDKAKRLLLSAANQVWFRDWKRNEWLREFTVANRLEEQNCRLAGFVQRHQ